MGFPLPLEKWKELLHLTKEYLAVYPHQQVLSSQDMHTYYSRFAPAPVKPAPSPPFIVSEPQAPVYAKLAPLPKRIEQPSAPLPKTAPPKPIVELPEKSTHTDFSQVREILAKRFPQIKIHETTPPPEVLSSKPTIDLYASPQNPEEQQFLEKVMAAITTYGGTPVLHPLSTPPIQKPTTFVLPQLSFFLNDPAQKAVLWQRLKPLLSVPK